MQGNRIRQELPHATVRLFRMVNREHGRALKALGLSAEQAHILAVLWARGAQTVGELGRAIALSSPTLTGALDRMEAQRLIRRTPSPTDARATIVHATTRRRLRARALASIARTSAACFGGLSQAERAHLLRLMTKVTDALEAREYDAPRGAGRGRGDRARRG